MDIFRTSHGQMYKFVGMKFFPKKSNKYKAYFLRFSSINALSDDVQNSIVKRPASFTLRFIA